MKRTYIWTMLTLVFSLVLLGAGCASSDETAQNPAEQAPKTEKVEVAATIFPVYDLVRRVGGDRIETHLILPTGTSPHVFEPTPSTLKKLSNTKLVFAIGVGLDDWADSIVKSGGNAKKVAFLPQLERDIVLHKSEPHEHEDEQKPEAETELLNDDHADEAFDPHYWLDPLNAMTMVRLIQKELSAIMPEYASEFKTNADNLSEQIQQYDIVWKKQIGALNNKNIVTFHDAFGYFAEHFGLEVVATFEEFPGKEPTPQYLAHLQEEIKLHNIKTMYLEPQLAKASLQSFAKDQNVALGVLDPIGGAEGRNSYIELMDYNVQTILATNN